MAVSELHPDAIICQDCGHDCDLMDCGDVCICVEEFDERADDMIDYAEHAYWDDFLASEYY